METEKRSTMNGKPVFTVPNKTIINFDSGFKQKLLCDGPTFTTGSACVYGCTYCYVGPQSLKQKPWLKEHGVVGDHADIVIRRANPVAIARNQLIGAKHKDQELVIYSSPAVDVAANLELVKETIEMCQLILDETRWHIRLLSKSNLLPVIAKAFSDSATKHRIIYGVSTGTLNDNLVKSFEDGTALVSKRIQSLHWLQDNGYRTFGMICPSLPLLPLPGFNERYTEFAQELATALRWDKLEFVWAEVMNVRGASFTKTIKALRDAGFHAEADDLTVVSNDKSAWEDYARDTFEAHAVIYRPRQLRFLQYVTKANVDYWKANESRGAVLL